MPAHSSTDYPESVAQGITLCWRKLSIALGMQ